MVQPNCKMRIYIKGCIRVRIRVRVRVRVRVVVTYIKIGRFGRKIGRFKTGTRKNGRKRVKLDVLA